MTTEHEPEATEQQTHETETGGKGITPAPLAMLDTPQAIVQACGLFGEKSDYIYEFSQNGSVVADLNIDAIRDIATQLGLVLEETTYSETESDWIVQSKACNPQTGAISLGVAKEPKATRNGLDNRYAFQAAVSKSQRNALRQLIPSSIPKMVLRHFGVTPAHTESETTDVLDTEAVDVSADISTDALEARDTLFAMYPDLSSEGEITLCTDDHDFWEFYKPNKDLLRAAKVYAYKDTDADVWICTCHSNGEETTEPSPF